MLCACLLRVSTTTAGRRRVGARPTSKSQQVINPHLPYPIAPNRTQNLRERFQGLGEGHRRRGGRPSEEGCDLGGEGEGHWNDDTFHVRVRCELCRFGVCLHSRPLFQRGRVQAERGYLQLGCGHLQLECANQPDGDSDLRADDGSAGKLSTVIKCCHTNIHPQFCSFDEHVHVPQDQVEVIENTLADIETQLDVILTEIKTYVQMQPSTNREKSGLLCMFY